MRVHPVCWAKFRDQQRCPQQLLTTMCERGREREGNIIVNSISRPTLADFSSRSSSFCPPLTEIAVSASGSLPSHLTPPLVLPYRRLICQMRKGQERHLDFCLFPISVHSSLTNEPHLDGAWLTLWACVRPCTCVREQVCKIYLASSDESQQQQN